jgi:23S rRNA (guanosine2251-2'-O)-methyltransferase
MILRSAAAGKIDAVMIPAKGSAPVVSPLTIKASAGTLFRIPILRCDDLAAALERMREEGAGVYVLDSHAERSFDEERYPERTVLVLGNESDGVSPAVRRVADRAVSIPMNRGVESLNVAVAAALLAFCG